MEEDYGVNETLTEMNERANTATVGPSRLCPWRHFGPTKRKCVEEEDEAVKNPRPPKRIVLKQSQQMNQSAILQSATPTAQVSIKAYFTPKSKS